MAESEGSVPTAHKHELLDMFGTWPEGIREIVNRARRMAAMCTWKSAAAIKVRELLVSAVPERQWLAAYEHEHAYQL